jgi:flagellar biosynthetic protein FlhB
MADESRGERTEEPTPKRLRDARRRGQVAQSRDLTGAAVLLAAVGALWASGSHLVGTLLGFLGKVTSGVGRPGEVGVEATLGEGLGCALVAIAPLTAAVVLLPALVSFLQVGGLLSGHPVVPRWERVSFVAGWKRIFSVQGLVETLKAAVKLSVAVLLSYAIGSVAVGDLVRTAGAPPYQSAALVAAVAFRIGVAVGIAFAGLAVLDLLYQRWRHRRGLRMTKYEVKREHRETEGDPHHRAQRQRIHREIVTHGMLQEVRRATVVVVNPEHVAVALVYEREGSGAPRVVAKGERRVAQEIVRIARESGVPVVRNVPLAQALNRLELGEEIPEELYEAVAEVLHFVYRLAEGRR